jgi:hypothetical protein
MYDNLHFLISEKYAICYTELTQLSHGFHEINGDKTAQITPDENIELHK